MEALKKVAEELFGNEFQCKIYKTGITLAAKNNSKGFSFGLMNYPGSFRVRENIYAMKRFEEVEAILQPLMKKYKIPQFDFDEGVYGVSFIGTIRKAIPIQEIPGVDGSFIKNYTHIETDNEAQIRQILTEFKKAIVYLENEFINKYDSLQQVYDGLEKMAPKERGELFTNPGPIKELIIEYLCNPSSNLDSQFEVIIKDYREVEKEFPEMFKNHDKVAVELQQYFKSQKA